MLFSRCTLLMLMLTFCYARYMRIQDDKCADGEIPSYIGPCPQRIIIFFGNLRKGNCIQNGFANFMKNFTIQAGPCGKIVFSMYGRRKKCSRKFGTAKTKMLPMTVRKLYYHAISKMQYVP